ncbi:coiled-coil and C2 domain-containing protein 1-like [Artemia franciscana]
MFNIFSREKVKKERESPARGERRRANNDELGIFGMNFDPGSASQDGSDDESLEAELSALAGGTKPKARPRNVGKKALPVDPNELDRMVSESMKDVEHESDIDEDDPELEQELLNLGSATDGEENSEILEEEIPEFPPPPIKKPLPPPRLSVPQPLKIPNGILGTLSERISMYELATKNALVAGETSRAKRYQRGLKTLKDMERAVKAGRKIEESEIPPPVATGEKKNEAPNPLLDIPVGETETPSETKKVPQPELGQAVIQETVSSVNEEMVKEVQQRRDVYKKAAVFAKQKGDTETALKYLRIVKQFEPLITAAEAGQPVDMDSLPPLPQEPVEAPMPVNVAPEAPMATPIAAVPVRKEEPSEVSTPRTVLEALEQRLQKYKSIEKQAKDEGNNSKARRFSRIVKQYLDAIKAHKAGRTIDYEELPCPPGYPPIPGIAPAQAAPGIGSAMLAPIETPSESVSNEIPSSVLKSRSPPAVPAKRETVAPSPDAKKAAPSLQQKQLDIILERQKQFKQAALEAKARGEINQAKEFLKISKGFDPLIEASKGGLPVDMKSIPLPPSQQAELESTAVAGFVEVNPEMCEPPLDLAGENNSDMKDIYKRLEIDLLLQLRTCLKNRDHSRMLGDMASANRMEQLGQEVKKDLDRLRVYKARNEPVPKYKYETKTFSIVRCNTELDDNVMEFHIVRGINFMVPNPKEVDTYVKFDFPWPSENPVKNKTTVIKDTNNPFYNQAFIIPINRQARSFHRVLKKTIKFEVFSKGSFFSGDKEVGKGNMKIQDLETKTEVHQIFDIFEGRKSVGKLEVKAKVRHPILAKQVENVTEKWVVLLE